MTITLKLGNETRTVEAKAFTIGIGPVVMVFGIELVTTCGTRRHLGSLTFKPKDQGATYTVADVLSADYSGCRGNGRNTAKSRFRHIGWAQEVK